jgi:hypothetical protein
MKKSNEYAKEIAEIQSMQNLPHDAYIAMLTLARAKYHGRISDDEYYFIMRGLRSLIH